MRAHATFSLVPLLLLASLAPALPTAHAQAGEVTIRLDALEAAYASEAWKDESAALGDRLKTSPFPTGTPLHSGTYANPYHDPTRPHGGNANYWGHVLTLEASLLDEAGDPVAAPGYFITARLETASGEIPAKLVKLNASGFRAVFDLDGENGKPWPALAAGEHAIRVEAHLAASDPTLPAQDAGAVTVPLASRTVHLDKLGFNIQEAHLPGYDDVTTGNHTRFHNVLQAPGDLVTASLATGLPDATVRFVLVNGQTSIPLHEAATDADGRASVQFEPSAVLGNAEAGLLLLAAHLTGDAGELGASVVALPVSTRQVPLAAITHEPRGIGGNPVPQLATVLVAAEDANATPESASRQGRLLLAKGDAVFAEAQFSPPSFLPATTRREARFQASVIPETFGGYNLLSLFLDERNGFYSFATATRGVGLTLAPVETVLFTQSALNVTVRNFNSNHDGADDPGLSATVNLTLEGLPGGGTRHEEVTLPEGGERTVSIPIETSTEGAFDVTVRAVLGEVVTERTVEVRVGKSPGFAGELLLNLTPVPGALPGLIALGAASLLLRRRI